MSKKSTKYLRVAIIGAGVRGKGLARKLSSSDLPVEIVAVAEPDDEKRKSFAIEFNLPDESTFSGWEDLVADFDECDAAVIATLDNQHTGPAIASLNHGWHILIEKPLSDNFEDCLQIVKKQEATNKVVAVCHTLRFMDGYRRVKQLIDSDAIGKIIHIEHMEGIGHFRFAHNYVRGRWAKEKNNTFLLLHKCSHDIDYINWLIEEPCERVSSFGSLKYFTPANAPAGSTKRCTDDCTIKDSCFYSALHIYVDGNLEEWPAKDICKIHTHDAHLEEIKHGPYGTCVWRSENDVVDHQTVMMEFKGGTTATCTLSGFSSTNGRRIRLQGTLGEILFDEATESISIKRFSDLKSKHIKITAPTSYHAEDQIIVDEWITAIVASASVTVDAREALRTHAVVFASEISRIENRTVEMKDFYKTFIH
jgi:predicted dehydrogenase